MENQNYSGFAANLLPTNAFVTSPVKYTQGYASTSIQKEFGSFFAAIGGSETGTAYRNIQDSFGNTIDETFQNGTVSTLNGRFGYHLSAVIYTFIESAGNWQRYNESLLNSEGYRVVAGVGSGRISLFSGELYAGYANQRFEDPLAGTTTVPVFGGKLSWFPTRFLTFTFNADRAFGTSDFNPRGLGQAPVPVLPGGGLVPGSVTTTTTAKLAANWTFSEKLGFTASVGDQQQDYLASSRRDNFVALSGGVTYQIWPGFGVTATYTYGQLFSNFPGASFTTNFISIGGTTKF
jgi:hypothetical protein